ncbi:Hydroperoxy fatty acid reductase gpx2 [Posidoniimonas polymericola]|uniref:Glutathione peroxidase n=1 Tax=Posidoniimonas polymericola TaxID=2528002 RepID=A0A5C5YCK5_9BACT|nr:Hydroperoxy fatty acid reductase gpx2 [Posidoniimonas polymericola]
MLIRSIVTMLSLMLLPAAKAAETAPDLGERASALDFEMAKLGKDGKVNLSKEYEGKVVMLVNVASRCGLTPQYEALQMLHEKYADRGLAIVGVPCNQFGGQEPGAPQEILTFCKTNYDVGFDLLEKSNVKIKGDNQTPIYQYLTSKQTNPEYAGEISWNFTKFLFNRDGDVIARFEPRTKPDSPEVVAAIEAALAEKK